MFGFKKKQRKLVMGGEEVKAVKVTDESINMKKAYVNDILRKKKLPIVLLDPLWLTAKEHIKSDEIENDEHALQELLKEQARLNTDYKEYTVIKQNFLKQILEISGKVQETSDQSQLDELNCLHQSTLGANQKLEDIENRLGEVEDEISEKNKAIVSEMIAIGYSYIENVKKENDLLEAEIEKLRAEMLEKTNKKKEGEKFIKDIYNYLHSIVGREHIEIMDKALGEKK